MNLPNPSITSITHNPIKGDVFEYETQLNESEPIEETLCYTLFKVTGTSTDAYYGYTKENDILKSFLRGFRRQTEDRADKKFVNDNGGVDNMVITSLDVFDNEEDAFIARNDIRGASCDSVTGPTLYPPSMIDRINAKDSSKVRIWKNINIQKRSKTARKAAAAGRWTSKQFKSLIPTFKRSDIVYDLDHLSPNDFSLKYSI